MRIVAVELSRKHALINFIEYVHFVDMHVAIGWQLGASLPWRPLLSLFISLSLFLILLNFFLFFLRIVGSPRCTGIWGC